MFLALSSSTGDICSRSKDIYLRPTLTSYSACINFKLHLACSPWWSGQTVRNGDSG